MCLIKEGLLVASMSLDFIPMSTILEQNCDAKSAVNWKLSFCWNEQIIRASYTLSLEKSNFLK